MTSSDTEVSICAIIAIRNEANYLRVLLPLLASQRIDVAIIDNESTDGSHDLYSQYTGHPVRKVETVPHRGVFSLSEQLAAKESVCQQLTHDWIIHHDADEILEHAQPGRTLRDAIQDAHAGGYNSLNFEEFVFLPEPGADYSNSNYRLSLLRYYFFEPSRNRLHRAWKRESNLRHGSSGGHHLQGDGLRLAPTTHFLRHYIVLSEEHARLKYLHRQFDAVDLNRGWHGNRLRFTEANLKLPDHSKFLFHLDSPDASNFRRDKPAVKHYWEWDDVRQS